MKAGVALSVLLGRELDNVFDFDEKALFEWLFCGTSLRQRSPTFF